MIGWGTFVIVLGAGSLLLPRVGFQFTVMQLVDSFQPLAGIVISLVGVAMVAVGMRRTRHATSAARDANR